MNKKTIETILRQAHSGRLTVEQAMSKLKSFPFHDMGFCKIDTHRSIRKGFPEVVYCAGKSIEQIKKIVSSQRGAFMATKASASVYKAIKKINPQVSYYRQAKIVAVKPKRKSATKPILVISAGTSDIPVAEEAAVCAEIMGNKVRRLFDVGVAGIHRLLEYKDALLSAQVIIVVAGMDGVLPSVVGGLVDTPVVAVPTSVGYGASFKGLAALLTMLNSCAPGVAVMNIDNGFGAGYFASIINRDR